jgi:hypothetical protein
MRIFMERARLSGFATKTRQTINAEITHTIRASSFIIHGMQDTIGPYLLSALISCTRRMRDPNPSLLSVNDDLAWRVLSIAQFFVSREVWYTFYTEAAILATSGPMRYLMEG